MVKHLLLAGLTLFAAFPATSTYQLNSYTFGSGGTAGSGTANYALEGSTGEVNGANAGTSNYSIKPAFINTQQAHVPTIQTFDNGSGQYYNKLHFVLNTQNNPTDATYALSISTDNFVADTRYVKSDLTVGNTLTVADYKTYASWGGVTGVNIIGLNPGTTYYLRAKATQGNFTESGYGPASSVATATQSITFSVTTSAQPSPPFSITFATLTAGTVNNSTSTANIALTTNAASGADVYITGKNNGLLSASTSALITSASADLASAGSGYGAQSSSVGQVSGGPLTAVSPYNGSAQNVGIISTTTRSLYTTSGPITTGAATLLLKAKSATTSIAASDYTDVLTLIAAGNF